MAETTLALIAIIISVGTAVGTFIYTHQQMKAAKRANELTEKAQQEQVQPYVVAEIRERVPGSQLLVFSIENTGPTMARDVKVTVDPPLRSTLGDDVEQTLNAAVSREIPVLPPKRQLTFLVDVGHKLFASDLPRRYTVVVKSAGPLGVVEPLTYTIDLDVLQHSLLNRESLEWSTHVLAEESKKARKAHEKQANAMAQLFRAVANELEARRTESPENEPPTSGADADWRDDRSPVVDPAGQSVA
ncbi:hypothetical protein [Streptomyces sp. 11-1-2]|uniref:hypothetical protein n=1 Tax=unclassified Streptomyces TaxID=2593676 RepID=UPI0013C419D8|nr:hypothetical protein [Streptomyces sp. 11-1-2]